MSRERGHPHGIWGTKQMSGFDWVDAIGYQHEVIHTGLLEWLLKDSELGPALCRELGLPEKEPGEVRRESKIPNFRGVADLVATFEEGSGPSRYLAVETKVNSTRFAQRIQLENTLQSSDLPDGSRGVLLALGVTHLCVTQDDLGKRLVGEGWNAIGPADWAEMLERIGVVKKVPTLNGYVDCVRAEADLHVRAIELADKIDARGTVDSDRLSNGRSVEDFAWLREVRLDIAQLPGGFACSEWFPYKNQSGPLMGVFPEIWEGAPAGAFLEFMCDKKKHRFLCLKLGGRVEVPSQLREEAQELALEQAGLSRPKRRAGAAAKNVTVARLDLTNATAREAAARTVDVYADLSEEIQKLLSRFSP